MNQLTKVLVRPLQLPVTFTRPSAPRMHQRIRPLRVSWDYGSKSRRVCVSTWGFGEVVYGVVADLLC